MGRRNTELPKNADVDPLIPIMNLVCMLIPLLIFGAVFVNYKTLNVKQQVPVIEGDSTPRNERLDLKVFITEKGFHLRVNPARRLPWMQTAVREGTGEPDIPKQGDTYNYKQLAERLAEIKEANPQEALLLLGAEDDVEFDVIVKVMDSARDNKDGPLFPDVTLIRGVLL